jgi:hypothetical protein
MPALKLLPKNALRIRPWLRSQTVPPAYFAVVLESGCECAVKLCFASPIVASSVGMSARPGQSTQSADGLFRGRRSRVRRTQGVEVMPKAGRGGALELGLQGLMLSAPQGQCAYEPRMACRRQRHAPHPGVRTIDAHLGEPPPDK